jgi:long-chain acyl-CoA synthetase
MTTSDASMNGTANLEAQRPSDVVAFVPWARIVPDLLDRAASDYPDRPAINFMGRRLSYAQLADSVERAARGLQALGVQKGDRVGLCLPNMPHFVIGYYAALKVGAVVVNYNPLYVERELAHQIEDSGTSVMFVVDIPDIHGKVAAVAERAGLRKIVVCSLADALPPLKSLLYKIAKRKQRLTSLPDDGRHVRFADIVAEPGPPRSVALSSEDVAVLQYTGGTTGVPKGAMLTHANVIANSGQNVAYDPTRKMGEERVLGVLPLFHVFAMTVVMNFAIESAAEMVLLPRYELKATLKAMLTTRPTVFPAVPTIYGAIAKLAEKEKRDLSFIQLCISGGAPLPIEIGDHFRRLTHAHLVEGYGLTETSPVVCCNPAKGESKVGSVGVPLVDTVIEIRDPETRALMPTGEKGEIIVRGPQVMKGYWNKPEETAAVLDAHGLRTGDIGYKDADGYIFIVDRIKDVILSGGYNVYPRVIEDALYQHADVAEAVVIGIADSYRGQAAKAFVVLRDGSTATPETLKTFLGDYVSKIELPKAIEIRKALPKTAVGKLSKKELVAEEQGRLA